MLTREHYKEALHRISGKTIAMIYIFEKEDAPGFEHYSVWGSDVIACWLQAIQDLGCLPLIFDVRTFVEKAMNRTLPHIDYLINLNAGSSQLSPMALIPATCSFLGIPCIPCDAMTIVVGENKAISNALATTNSFKVPRTLDINENGGIFRPLNFGSSIGVRRGPEPNQIIDGLYQEFIHGFDITTPLVYNPMTDEMDFLPTIAYIPDSHSNQWYFGENEKHTKKSYVRTILTNINQSYYDAIRQLVNQLNITTFCRIDARVETLLPVTCDNVEETLIGTNNTYFIEINPMPTVRKDNSFGFSYSNIDERYVCNDLLKTFSESIDTPTVHNYLLANSMISLQPHTEEEGI